MNLVRLHRSILEKEMERIMDLHSIDIRVFIPGSPLPSVRHWCVITYDDQFKSITLLGRKDNLFRKPWFASIVENAFKENEIQYWVQEMHQYYIFQDERNANLALNIVLYCTYAFYDKLKEDDNEE